MNYISNLLDDVQSDFATNVMPVLRYVLFGIIIASAIVMIITTLMQQSESNGSLDAFTGTKQESYYSQNKGASKDSILKKITIAIDGFSSCCKSTMAKDLESEIIGCAAFETVGVDETIVSLSPSVMMYSAAEDQLNISVSNPDLALYEGESDEIFDENGKRKERSVYGRAWVANPSHTTFVEIVFNGTWNVEGDCKMQVTYDTNRTIIKIETFESRTEALTLKINTTN